MALTWAIFKMKSALVGAWFKKNWKTVTIVIAIAALTIYQIVSRTNDKKTINALIKQLDQSRKDYEHARELARQEILRRQQLEEAYKKVIADITSKYNADMAELAKDKQQQVKEVIAETNGNPTAMASRINTVLGIPLYQEGEQL